MDNKCYLCGKEATSREHVPPKCLFPEDKDINNILKNSFRSGLITVPSCEEHNLSKSNDDEYLMVCLSSKVGNNGIAYIHTNTKIRRALQRNPKLIDIIMEDKIEIENIEFPVLSIKIDTERLLHSFESIARGIFFYETQTIYDGKCYIISSIFKHSDDNEFSAYQIKGAALLNEYKTEWKKEIKGNNPEIFTYLFSPMDGRGTFVIKLTFYEKTVVYVLMNFWEKFESEESKNAWTKHIKPEVDKFLKDIKSNKKN